MPKQIAVNCSFKNELNIQISIFSELSIKMTEKAVSMKKTFVQSEHRQQHIFLNKM